jgi:O-antigen ligase
MPSPARTRALEAGLFLILVGTPLAFFPASQAPFADVKLVCLLAGVLLIATATPVVNARIAAFAGAWALACTVATVFGVDRWWSVLGPENQDTGLVLIASAAVLCVAGTGVPSTLRERIPAWMAWTGTAVGAVAVVHRLVPGTFTPAVWNLARGSTLGQAVLMGGFASAAIAASVGVNPARRWHRYAGLVIVASALTVSANRSGMIATAAGLGVALRRARIERRTAAAMLAVVAVTVVAWSAADALLTPSLPLSPAKRFTEIEPGSSARERPAVWTASVRGWSQRPVTGWGPGTTWGAYLHAATAAEVRAARRAYGDAHNLFVESAATTGVVGLVTLAALGGVLLAGVRRAPPSYGWASGAATALVVHHLLQPMSVTLTPLLFLVAGMAVSHRAGPRPLPRPPIVAALAAASVLAVLRLGASSLEHSGRTYGDMPALRAAGRLEPGRLSSRLALARMLALEGRSGDRDAAAEARRLAAGDIRRHAWNPSVRLAAADIDVLLGRRQEAGRWIDDDLRRFPHDPLALFGAATLALERGDRAQAVRLARRSDAIQPSPGARRIQTRATSGP